MEASRAECGSGRCVCIFDEGTPSAHLHESRDGLACKSFAAMRRRYVDCPRSPNTVRILPRRKEADENVAVGDRDTLQVLLRVNEAR